MWVVPSGHIWSKNRPTVCPLALQLAAATRLPLPSKVCYQNWQYAQVPLLTISNKQQGSYQTEQAGGFPLPLGWTWVLHSCWGNGGISRPLLWAGWISGAAAGAGGETTGAGCCWALIFWRSLSSRQKAKVCACKCLSFHRAFHISTNECWCWLTAFDVYIERCRI